MTRDVVQLVKKNRLTAAFTATLQQLLQQLCLRGGPKSALPAQVSFYNYAVRQPSKLPHV
jgi:hypothetical protein